MLTAVTLLIVLPTLGASSGAGNIHLLEDEVATALHSCMYNESMPPTSKNGNIRRIRSNNHDDQHRQVPRIDTKYDDRNIYGHEKRNSSNQMYSSISNGREGDIPSYGRTDTSVKYVKTSTTSPKNAYNNSVSNVVRRKRSGYLINKSDQDQCLSQCVFANLQVVDDRGIPREADLWNKVQTALTSQQSRTLLRDQIRACFQELQTEEDDNGCSYSNKLERCLMLRFSDRKLNDKT